ncbi:MAG: hypothetical protein AAF462_02535 [Thermodesulfobacteriota bacterium]
MTEKNIDNSASAFTTLHGVLIEINRVGVLILGESGIGKSENALELITRGSKLISDDIVVIKINEHAQLIGSSPITTKNLLEIRGIGIINIKDLYGNNSVTDSSVIDITVELSIWDSETDYDRLGVEDKYYCIMGVEVPYLLIPTTPGKNISTLLEAAALNHLHKLSAPKGKLKIVDEDKTQKTASDIK